MSKCVEQSDLDAFRADSYMYDICEMQHEIDKQKRLIDELKSQIEDHKQVRNMLDVELAKSNKKLEAFKKEYKV